MQPDSFQCPSSVYSVFPFISLSLYRYAALFLLCFIFRPYWISMKSNLIPIRSDWLRSLKRDFCLRNFSISNILFKCKENVSNSSFIALPHKIDALFTVPLFLHFFYRHPLSTSLKVFIQFLQMMTSMRYFQKETKQQTIPLPFTIPSLAMAKNYDNCPCKTRQCLPFLMLVKYFASLDLSIVFDSILLGIFPIFYNALMEIATIFFCSNL